MSEFTDKMTYGEKAVGTHFNPSEQSDVAGIKLLFAEIIDVMDRLRNTSKGEQVRLASIAITEAQTAQMWAVKALTWRD